MPNPSILILLGEHLDYLYGEFNRVDAYRSLDSEKNNIAAQQADDLQNRILNTLFEISGHQAETIQEVAIQIRAIKYFNTAQTDECDRAGNRLCYSVLNFIEPSDTRDKWAGNVLMPAKHNVFNHDLVARA